MYRTYEELKQYPDEYTTEGTEEGLYRTYEELKLREIDKALSTTTVCIVPMRN